MNILESLQALNPEAEIWWDSSPLMLDSWIQDTLAHVPAETKAHWTERLARFSAAHAPDRCLIRGATTNPSLCFQMIQHNPDHWGPAVDNLIAANPDADIDDIYWLTYRQVAEESAALMLPLWERSAGKYGWLSVQVDPRYIYDAGKMLEQGLEIGSIAPNIMVKVPGSTEGYQTIEQLTAQGISTNNTLCFTVAQAAMHVEAIHNGLKRARKRRVELARWRSVITHMTGRFGTKGDLLEEAQRRNIQLDDADIRCGEVAVLKRIYWMLQTHNHPVKLLLSSMKVSQSIDPVVCWHIESTAGGNLVYTCPPCFIRELMENEDRTGPLRATAIDEDVNSQTLEKLSKLPYFVKGYEVCGMNRQEFNHHPALIATVAEFAAQARRMIDFVALRFERLHEGFRGQPILWSCKDDLDKLSHALQIL
jgi:transaldolase